MRGVVSPKEIAVYRPALVETVDRYDLEQQTMEKTVSGQSQGWKFVKNLYQLDLVAQRFILAHRFGKIAADLLGVDTVRLFRDQSYFKKPGGGNTPWHQDGYFMPLDTTQTVTMWIALSEVSSEMALMTFVTGSHRQGYIGASTPLDESMDEFEQSITKSGKWGYNRFPPGDADSTGWVLQLAHAIGESNSERARQAMQSLAAHKRPDGGICTYESEESIRAFIHASSEIGFEGWCGSHTCVSAAIAALPEYRFQLQDYLQLTQQNDGSWLAYWWQDPEYATALAAEAIAACYPDSDCITSAVAWGMNRLSSQGFVATSDNPSGSPFATAWCLRLLTLRGQDTAVQAAIAKATDWLLAQQQPNGSWISSARLLVPLPDDLNPNKFNQWIYHGTIQGSLVFDKHCVFTTATVLQALHRSTLSQQLS